MSGIYNHRQMGPAQGGRIPELLETLKSEYDNLTQDVGLFNRQKDDVEGKCTKMPHFISPFPHFCMSHVHIMMMMS